MLQRAARRTAEQSPTGPDVRRARCTGWQGVQGGVKGYITLKGFYRKPAMWPNSTRCFAHTSTGRQQEGPLGWSNQLHNADTFSLTSVKLAKKRGKKELCPSLGIKKKKKNTSLKNTWHHRFTYDATLYGISSLINTLTLLLGAQWSCFLHSYQHLDNDSTVACWCYQIQPVTGTASPPKPALPLLSTNATIDHIQQINGPLNKQPCQIQGLSESQYNGSRNLLGRSWRRWKQSGGKTGLASRIGHLV